LQGAVSITSFLIGVSKIAILFEIKKEQVHIPGIVFRRPLRQTV